MLELSLGAIVLAFDIWAIVQIIGSSSPGARKVLWALIVFLMPVVGLVAWFLVGPKGAAVTGA